MELLLQAGADPFAVDPKRHTYIHIAARYNLPQSIRTLVARGVDVNIKVIKNLDAVYCEVFV